MGMSSDKIPVNKSPHIIPPLEQLISDYQRPLVGYIACRISGPREDAENMAQEIWLDLMKECDQPEKFCNGYDPSKSAFFTYLINRFVRFHIRRYHTDRMKTRQRIAFVENPEMLAQPHDEPGSDSPMKILELKEELHLMTQAYHTLFAITFLCGGYPHQQLAFGFAKHIMGTRSPRRIEARAADLEDKYACLTLDQLASEYWKIYSRKSGLSESELLELQPRLNPMLQHMDCAVPELLRYGQQLQERMKSDKSDRSGNTTLNDYLSQRTFGISVSDWCDKVERRVRAVIQGSGPFGDASDNLPYRALAEPEPGVSRCCSRCKLRHLPPCAPEISHGKPELKPYNGQGG